MRESILDIRRRISDSSYQNEEHVRICIVARILQQLGWDIWNPEEVYAEFIPNREEDTARVDFALFSPRRTPCVFVEVKAIGRIRHNLEDSERQLRDYNRNLTAMFSVLTDGQVWRLYLSQAGGDFSRKCFKVLDFLDDEIEDIEEALRTFLAKDEIISGKAETESKSYLRLNEKQRIMDDCLSEARRIINRPPYPSLPNALVQLVQENGFEISIDEATEFIESDRTRVSPAPVPQPQREPNPRDLTPRTPAENPDEYISFPPDRPPSLRFTKVESACVGDERCDNWNSLVDSAIRVSMKSGLTIQDIRRITTMNIDEGMRSDAGFHQIPGLSISVQGMDSDKCYLNAYLLAKRAAVELKVQFRWRNKEGALHPGQYGKMHYDP